MTTRYFKATNGEVTVFRASATKVYAFASFGDKAHLEKGYAQSIGFSAVQGDYPVIEITKAEYDALVARKTERINGHNQARKEAGLRVWRSVSPSDSWVENN